MGLWEERGGRCERQKNMVIVTSANTDTQIVRVPWSPPANKQGQLELLIISNQHAANSALIKLFDAELVTSGTPGSTLPPVRGTAAAPLIPYFNLAAGSQIVLDKNSCPNVDILSGLACQVTEQPIQIYAQVIVFARGT